MEGRRGPARAPGAAVKVVLIVEGDAAVRRRVSDVLMGAGYGVCETHSTELVPAVPRLDAVVSGGAVGLHRFDAPVVAITEPLDAHDLLTRVERAICSPDARAA